MLPVLGTNRMNGMTYDQAGNLTQLSPNIGEYDAENRLKKVMNGSTAISESFYDGTGRRVKKTTGPNTVVYVYDASGNLMAEDDPGLMTTGTQYLVADHLGSTRMVLGADGTCVHRIDYLPFGGESPRTEPCYGGDPPTNLSNVSLKFTGKERDAETGLDYFGARYMSAAQGRFTGPDTPLAYSRPDNPQTWNLYSYVGNNPLKTVDLDGHCGVDWNCWNEFGSGVADTTYRPIFQAISNPVQTIQGVASAITHPVDTTVAIKNAVVETTNAALSGDPNAIGKAVGTVVSVVATAGAAKAVTSLTKGTATTNLYRAVTTAEADSISAARAFTAAPNGTEFKGFFFAEADAQSFGSRMTQMTGETHSVVTGAAPTRLVKSSPSHSAATEGQGVLIRNENLSKVKVRNP